MNLLAKYILPVVVLFFIILPDSSKGQLLNMLMAKKYQLEGKNIREVTVSYVEKEATYTLGSGYPIIISALLDDGKNLKTEGAGKGKTTWDNYTVEVEGGKFENGLLWVDGDVRNVKQHQVKLLASVKSNPSQKAELVIPLNYESDLYARFGGFNGREGAQGHRGNNGESNSTWPTGGHGGDGGQGGQGGNGDDGQEIEVFALVKTEEGLGKDLLYVKVVGNSSKELCYAIDPLKAKITVDASGGNGGSGGWGGPGGSGGSGVNGGNGATGGFGGNGGDGGNGGNIKVTLDPSAEKYASRIICNNYGGGGGAIGPGGTGGSGGGSYGGSNGSSGKSGGMGTQQGRSGQPGSAVSINVKQLSSEIFGL